ncbi:hypothetical protein MHYP_G00129390 [Metynnis hypsauchen]
MAEMTGCKGILGQRGNVPTSGSILKLGSYPKFELVCRTEISLATRLVTWITRMWSSSYVECVMLWADCKVLDAMRVRRRSRGAVRKLSCSFWFLLLFGAGGLLLFIHLQDLSDMVQQQGPGQ